jgi:hypothetical protein
MWKSVALPIMVMVVKLSKNWGYMYMLMGCYGWENGYLKPGERESAPILRIQTGVLHSGLVGQADVDVII